MTPYKGLAAFSDSDLDALLFFGRGREIEVIVANLIASRGGDHNRALLAESPGNRAPDAPPGAGHQRNFPVELEGSIGCGQSGLLAIRGAGRYR